jgi:hypothetical protein
MLYLNFKKTMLILCPGWYKSLHPKKQEELPSYAIGLIHHFCLAPYCLWRLAADYAQYVQLGGGIYNQGVLNTLTYDTQTQTYAYASAYAQYFFPPNHYDSLFCNYGLYPLTIAFFLVDTVAYAGE